LGQRGEQDESSAVGFEPGPAACFGVNAQLIVDAQRIKVNAEIWNTAAVEVGSP
jgi:hypothetical protein